MYQGPSPSPSPNPISINDNTFSGHFEASFSSNVRARGHVPYVTCRLAPWLPNPGGDSRSPAFYH